MCLVHAWAWRPRTPSLPLRKPSADRQPCSAGAGFDAVSHPAAIRGQCGDLFGRGPLRWPGRWTRNSASRAYRDSQPDVFEEPTAGDGHPARGGERVPAVAATGGQLFRGGCERRETRTRRWRWAAALKPHHPHRKSAVERISGCGNDRTVAGATRPSTGRCSPA